MFKALDEREAEGAEELRKIELARLDALQVSLWDRAMAGDVDAVLAVLRIMDRRIRLLSLATPGSRSHPSQDTIPLVVGPLEGNPEEATLGDVRRSSRRYR